MTFRFFRSQSPAQPSVPDPPDSAEGADRVEARRPTRPRLATGHVGDPAKTYLTTTEAAEFAGVAAKTVRAWVHRGGLRPHWAGRLLRIRLDELMDFLASGQARSSATPASREIADRILANRRAV